MISSSYGLRAFSVAAAVLPGLAACGSDALPGARGIALRDSAGLRIIETSAPVDGRGSGWRVEAAPLLQIGAVDGDAPYLFASLGAMARLSDGRIVVSETRTGQVRYFDPDGLHIQSVLGRGEGPGELRTGGGRFIVSSGDSLVVMDRLDRLVLDEEGRFVRRLTLRPEVLTDLIGLGSGDGGTWTASGSYVAHLVEPLAVPLTPGGLQRQVMRVARVSPDLAEADTLFQIRASQYQVTADRGLASPPFYAAPRFGLSVTGETYVIADGELSEVHRLRDVGTHEIVRWTQDPVPITAADV
jgi:hypothetical protein